ncbi:hypothetical protein PENARI_c082G08031, partial [Penicillium arizonense]
MERIQRPATYWGSRIAEVETNGGLIHTPEIWIVAITPNQPTHEAPTELATSEEPFDALVQPVESKYMYRDPDTSMPVMWLKVNSLPSEIAESPHKTPSPDLRTILRHWIPPGDQIIAPGINKLSTGTRL